MTITSKRILIFPEMAKKYLEKNKKNRHLSSSRIKAMVEDMRSGKWIDSHQGIAFSDKGVLLDGQHRLYAIISFGGPIAMNVSWGVPEEALTVIDTGRSRNFNDISKLAGLMINRDHSAVARMLEYGPTPASHIRVTTINQQLDLIEKYKDRVDFAVSSTKGIKKFHIANKTAIASAFSQDRKTRLFEFVDAYKNPYHQPPENAAASALHEFMHNTLNLSDPMNRPAVYYTTERAIEAFLNYRKISKLRPKRDENNNYVDLFPISKTIIESMPRNISLLNTSESETPEIEINEVCGPVK